MPELDVDVRCEPAGEHAWTCHARIREGATATEHTIDVCADDLARYAPDAADPTDLVTRSLRFLLAREPKESILRRFDLPVIGRYFPDWERTIRR